jgi:hypothetical protein
MAHTSCSFHRDALVRAPRANVRHLGLLHALDADVHRLGRLLAARGPCVRPGCLLGCGAWTPTSARRAAGIAWPGCCAARTWRSIDIIAAEIRSAQKQVLLEAADRVADPTVKKLLYELARAAISPPRPAG